MFESMKKKVKEAAYAEVNEHLRNVLSVEKWNLCSGLSWNTLRWFNDILMWDVGSTDQPRRVHEEARKRHTITKTSVTRLIPIVPLAEMRKAADEIVSDEFATRSHDRWAWRGGRFVAHNHPQGHRPDR